MHNEIFITPRGVEVSDLTGIKEGYQVSKLESGKYRIIANVTAGKISVVFEELLPLVQKPAFLFLECGTNQKVEAELRKTDADPLHKDIFYLDGQNGADLRQILSDYCELLVNDGMITFGVGSHVNHDEIMVGKYKIFTVLSEQPAGYEAVFVRNEIEKVEVLKTVWDNFTQQTPGSVSKIEVNGIDIYTMINRLSGQGLYLAGRREA